MTPDTPAPTPIKVRLTGNAREFLATALHTHYEDDDFAAAGYATTQRQKTNLIIETEAERAALIYELRYWIDGPTDAHPCITSQTQQAYERVLAEVGA